MDRQQLINALNVLGTKVSDYNKLDAIALGYVREAEAVRLASDKATKAGASTASHRAYLVVLLTKAKANAELREACFQDMTQALDKILVAHPDQVFSLCREDIVAQANLMALMDFAGLARPPALGSLEVN